MDINSLDIEINDGKCSLDNDCLTGQSCYLEQCTFNNNVNITNILQDYTNVAKILTLTFGLNELIILHFFIYPREGIIKYSSKDLIINKLIQNNFNKLVNFLSKIFNSVNNSYVIDKNSNFFNTLKLGFYKEVENNDKKLAGLKKCNKSLPKMIQEYIQSKISNDIKKSENLKYKINNLFLGNNFNFKTPQDLYFEQSFIAYQTPIEDGVINKTFKSIHLLKKNIVSGKIFNGQPLENAENLNYKIFTKTNYYTDFNDIITWILDKYENQTENAENVMEIIANILYDNMGLLSENERKLFMSKMKDKIFIKNNLLPNLQESIDVSNSKFYSVIKIELFNQLTDSIKGIWKIITDKYNDILKNNSKTNSEVIQDIYPSYLNLNYHNCPIDHLLNNGCCVKMNSKTPLESKRKPIEQKLNNINSEFLSTKQDSKKYEKDKYEFETMSSNLDSYITNMLELIKTNLHESIEGDNTQLFVINHPKFLSVTLKIILDIIKNTCNQISIYKLGNKPTINTEFDIALIIFDNFTKLNYSKIMIEIKSVVKKLNTKVEFKQKNGLHIVSSLVPIICNSIKDYITRLVYYDGLSELLKFINQNKCQQLYKIPNITFDKSGNNIILNSTDKKEIINVLKKEDKKYYQIALQLVKDYPNLKNKLLDISNIYEYTNYSHTEQQKIKSYVDSILSKKGGSSKKTKKNIKLFRK